MSWRRYTVVLPNDCGRPRMMSTRVPRVALFTDSYYEANGVARTASSLEHFARRRQRPMLVVHGGRVNQTVESGSVVRLELQRWPGTSCALEHDLDFDVALWRHARRVRRMLRDFRPDVVHVTGPSDIGLLGACLAGRLRLPLVGSWHTNLHEYASRRFMPYVSRLDRSTRAQIGGFIERHALSVTLWVFAPPPLLPAPHPAAAGPLRARPRQTGLLLDPRLRSPA